MLELLGFFAILLLTLWLKEKGWYKHFVIISLLLLSIGIIFKIKLLIFAATPLLGSFMVLLLFKSDGVAVEPHSHVDLDE